MPEVEMLASNDEVSAFLEHVGVKGMKWGVRRDLRASKSIYSSAITTGISKSGKDIEKLNKAFTEKGDFSETAVAGYYKKLHNTISANVKSEIAAKTSVGGRKFIEPLVQVFINQSNGDLTIGVTKAELEHSNTSITSMTFKLITDTNGLVISIEPVKDPSALDDMPDVVEHFGVKGMKWGVRRARSARGAAEAVKTAKRAGKIEKHNQKPREHIDITGGHLKSKHARKEIRSKRRKLTNDELKAYIDRLEKEKKLKSLIDEDLSPGKKATKQLLSDSGKKVAGKTLTTAGSWAVKQLIKKHYATASLDKDGNPILKKGAQEFIDDFNKGKNK